MAQVINVEIRDVYGRKLIYPAGPLAERFAAIAGTKTLSKDNLRDIEALGFGVREIKRPYLVEGEKVKSL